MKKQPKGFRQTIAVVFLFCIPLVLCLISCHKLSPEEINKDSDYVFFGEYTLTDNQMKFFIPPDTLVLNENNTCMINEKKYYWKPVLPHRLELYEDRYFKKKVEDFDIAGTESADDGIRIKKINLYLHPDNPEKGVGMAVYEYSGDQYQD